MKTIAERIRLLREKNGERPAGIAALLGVEKETYEGFEKTGRISAVYLRELALHYDVSIDYMVGLTDVPYTLKEHFEKTARLYNDLSKNDRQKVIERMIVMRESYGDTPGSEEKE